MTLFFFFLQACEEHALILFIATPAACLLGCCLCIVHCLLPAKNKNQRESVTWPGWRNRTPSWCPQMPCSLSTQFLIPEPTLLPTAAAYRLRRLTEPEVRNALWIIAALWSLYCPKFSCSHAFGFSSHENMLRDPLQFFIGALVACFCPHSLQLFFVCLFFNPARRNHSWWQICTLHVS